MPSGQGHHRRLKSGPERRSANLRWHSGAGSCPAVAAAQLMSAMLSHDHADRRQLAHLVATEPPPRPALPIIKPAPATATRLRVVIDDLIHLILGLQIATRTPMPGLPTRPALLTLPTHQLLGLRTRLRPPLRTRLRRIRRRRPRTRTRILPRLLLQPPQPLLVLHDPACQLEDELDTRLTPRVIDRLRLGAVHACKIRCTNEESLPQAPTTERLPDDLNSTRSKAVNTGSIPVVASRSTCNSQFYL